MQLFFPSRRFHYAHDCQAPKKKKKKKKKNILRIFFLELLQLNEKKIEAAVKIFRKSIQLIK